jgi:predicted HTH domain antitoxin
MAETISVRLEDKTVKELEELKQELKTAKSEVLRIVLDIGIKQLKIQKALQLLREGKISVGKASELAGVTIYEMLELMKEQEIPYGYTIKDLEDDLKRFK